MKIEVVPHCPEWSAAFEAEKQAIDALGIRGIRGIREIHHIGSTSVEGLAAKPIIDIMIEAASLGELDQNAGAFETLGYEAMGEFGIEGRRYYRKGERKRTHQIHAFQTADPNLLRHRAFRDYLQHHPTIKNEYAALKMRVADSCGNDMDRYCQGKDAFIKLYEAKALEWIDVSC